MYVMRNLIITISLFLICISCKKEVKPTDLTVMYMAPQNIEYAKGLTIKSQKGYKEVIVSTPWPKAKQELRYILHPKGTAQPFSTNDTHTVFIQVPIDRMIVTSTTDIPMLEALGLEHKLVGFPHTDYISSEKTRALIDNGSIKELGEAHSLNTEIILELDPELVIGFSSSGDIKAYDLIQKTGIPVAMNGSWMEQHPLGRAEWIKFISAFFGKEAKADSIFQDIKKEYTTASLLAQNVSKTPTILSGNMFKDIWYIPGGKSYVAQFFKDANTKYLWADSKTSGSLSLNFENVLEKGQHATLWIGAGNAKSIEELKEQNPRYELFEAFKNKTVYSSALRTGATGGLIYYELGPMRPDLILKDMIKIAHPELLPDYNFYFFEKLE
ncbi:ABC transporter substrate-binding protein [Aquimarina algicola]|uniref:ABC transporter substrate-binding protein n=2 Tax=Aquimarina algicola TaxID=2589995 RepID=A0A504J3Z2_9FLAO|nr:ABC transporter substrate-binding protein [Aquimarina algicola]